MTALTGDEYVQRALKAGADVCVPKFSHAGDPPRGGASGGQ
jgi:hypothetical protein